MFSHIIGIKFLPNGNKWVITIQVLVWISDTFAYLVGMRIGRKFFKRGLSMVSPKKSIEGSIGSFVFTIIMMFILRFTLFRNIEIALVHVFIIPVLVSIVGQMGDLSESVFKREFDVKDSSRLLGDHGGVLDRFDSLIFAFPIMYYYLKFFIVS
jgi:phosphatidate cytidylyltransferase